MAFIIEFIEAGFGTMANLCSMNANRRGSYHNIMVEEDDAGVVDSDEDEDANAVVNDTVGCEPRHSFLHAFVDEMACHDPSRTAAAHP